MRGGMQPPISGMAQLFEETAGQAKKIAWRRGARVAESLREGGG